MNEFTLHTGLQQVVKKLDETIKSHAGINDASGRISDQIDRLGKAVDAIPVEVEAMKEAYLLISRQITGTQQEMNFQFAQMERMARFMSRLAWSSWGAFILSLLCVLCAYLKR